MNNAVDGLAKLTILGDEGNEEHDDIAGHNIQIAVIHRDFDGLSVTGWHLGNRLDDISNVS